MGPTALQILGKHVAVDHPEALTAQTRAGSMERDRSHEDQTSNQAEAQESDTPEHWRYFPRGRAQAVTAGAQGPFEFGIICCRV